MLQAQQGWEVRQLIEVLTRDLIPFAETLSREKLILPNECGKAALGPYPPDRAADEASGKELPESIVAYQGHRHIEWVFGFVGEAELAVEDRRYLLARGDLAILPSFVPHLERIHETHTPYQAIWFCLYNQLIRIHASSYRQADRFEKISGATILNCADICKLFQEGTEEAHGRPLAWLSLIRARATEALVRIARHIDQHGLHAANQSLFSMIELAKTHIETHYAEDLSLKKISQLVYLSPNYFSSLFSQAMGKTVIEYIQEVRLNAACRLLRESSIPVKEVGGWWASTPRRTSAAVSSATPGPRQATTGSASAAGSPWTGTGYSLATRTIGRLPMGGGGFWTGCCRGGWDCGGTPGRPANCSRRRWISCCSCVTVAFRD
ncbi:MAG: AraC family transcriptional regulator [Planctomycetota bacterium]|nr:AraC family transcriptional regulator [Planctomycetota bacterium]